MSIIVRPTSIKCVWSLDTCFEKLSVSKAYVSQDHLPKSPKKEISEKKKKKEIFAPGTGCHLILPTQTSRNALFFWGGWGNPWKFTIQICINFDPPQNGFCGFWTPEDQQLEPENDGLVQMFFRNSRGGARILRFQPLIFQGVPSLKPNNKFTLENGWLEYRSFPFEMIPFFRCFFSLFVSGRLHVITDPLGSPRHRGPRPGPLPSTHRPPKPRGQRLETPKQVTMVARGH